MQDSASGGDSARQFVGADGERSRQRRRSATDAAHPLRVHIGPLFRYSPELPLLRQHRICASGGPFFSVLPEKNGEKRGAGDALYCALTRAIFWPLRGLNALFGRKADTFPMAYGSGQMYYTHLRAACDNFGSAHFRNTRPVTILHHRRIRRWPAISTAGCFASFLRGSDSRWKRCSTQAAL